MIFIQDNEYETHIYKMLINSVSIVNIVKQSSIKYRLKSNS